MRTQSLKAGLALFRLRTLESLQYRAAALASGSISVFWALIEITVYSVFYAHGENRGAALGLTLGQLVSYIWIGQALIGLQTMSIDGEILTKIQNGDVGIELCRPLDLYIHWFSKIAAGRLSNWWRMIITVMVGLLMPAAYRLSPPASLLGFLLFFCSLASAFFLCTAYGMLMTVVRLGITWGEGPTYILMLISGVLSGGYLPLQLWPDFLQPFLFFQPFAGYLDIPTRLYVGSMPPGEAPYAILIQLVWTGIFIVWGKLLLQKKLKNIIVQGG
jgi:ABC-2 type transport system permease protein